MQFCKIRDVKSPTRGTSEAAGLDFYVPNDMEGFSLASGQSINIPSGIKMMIPKGYVGIILNKSGVGIKGVLVGAQVIDSDYRGEVHLNVHNVGCNPTMRFEPGQKLVQMLIMPICLDLPMELSELSYINSAPESQRGEGAFGSTGQF